MQEKEERVSCSYCSVGRERAGGSLHEGDGRGGGENSQFGAILGVWRQQD